MAQVAPAGIATGPRPGDASFKGNGCCLVCCGGNPGPVPTDKIALDDGKFVKLEDGRVVEYFVFGSDKSDAKVLITQNGSMGTGWLFSHVEKLNAKMKELNIKGISITRHGSAYSSMNIGCNLLYWAENDVLAILKAENVDKFFIEGVSQGSGEALAIAYVHHAKVEKLHVIVPMLPVELSKEVMPHAVRCKNEPGGYPFTAKNVKSCKGCCCPCMGASHCMVACGCCCTKSCASAKSTSFDAYTEKHAPGSADLQFRDMKRLNKHHGGAQWLWAMGDEYGAGQWGFDLRDLASRIKGQDKVLVTFASDDCSSHPDWGRYITTLLDASYQIGEGKSANPLCENGHSFWVGRQMNGLLCEQLAQLEAPGQEQMGPRCVNEYWDKSGPEPVPVPKDFSLEVKKPE